MAWRNLILQRNGGAVGIGTNAPQAGSVLDVNGTIHVSGVVLVGQDVTLNGKLNKFTGGALVDQGGCYNPTEGSNTDAQVV